MVLAIEMGVVFVLLTAILIALYIAWQNAKFVGDRLRKKQVMKRLVAGGEHRNCQSFAAESGCTYHTRPSVSEILRRHEIGICEGPARGAGGNPRLS